MINFSQSVLGICVSYKQMLDSNNKNGKTFVVSG